ncbi:hypothetical protein E4U58_006468 [Claviceps cyperi]|nr:hypothetical protein E4U58_006468 [Claviceps cyperi]
MSEMRNIEPHLLDCADLAGFGRFFCQILEISARVVKSDMELDATMSSSELPHERLHGNWIVG